MRLVILEKDIILQGGNTMIFFLPITKAFDHVPTYPPPLQKREEVAGRSC
jgi:hypothetical protein